MWRVISLQSGEEVATFTSEGFFTFHPINAFERESNDDGSVEEVVVDLITFPSAAIISGLYLNNLYANFSQVNALWVQATPQRFLLPVGEQIEAIRAGTGAKPGSLPVSALPVLAPPTPLGFYAIELPTVNPAFEGLPYRYAFAMGLTAASGNESGTMYV